MKIRVVVCENLPDLNELHVAKLDLYPDTEVVGTALDLNAGLDVIEETRPDAVLLDLRYDGWPEERTWDAVRYLKKTYPDMVIVAYTAYEQYREKAMAEGCDSALYRGGSMGIRQAYDEIVRLAKLPRRPTTSFDDLGLTNKPKVIDAFKARVHGLTQPEAADRRGVALNTQKNQERAFRKALQDFMWLRREEAVQVNDMAKAITLAVRIGLVDETDFDPD